MTDVKSSQLYKTLKKAVRKEDHAELLRMLEMVNDGQFFIDHACSLRTAFFWDLSPQGMEYWKTLSDRLVGAGHDCY